MTSVAFRSLCIELFGKHGWQIGCARFLKKSDGTHVNVRKGPPLGQGRYAGAVLGDRTAQGGAAQDDGIMSQCTADRISVTTSQGDPAGAVASCLSPTPRSPTGW